MNGSARRRGNRWEYVLDLGPDPATGKRRQETRSGFATKREALAALDDKRAELRAGVAGDGRQTLAAFVEEWLTAVEPSLKATTVAGYRTHLRSHVVPRIGGLELRRVDAGHLTMLYSELLATGGRYSQGVSALTVRHVHRVLRRALRDAQRWGRIPRNPSELVDPPKPQRRDMTTWTADETATFLRSVEGHDLEAMWWLAATTGLRRGELLGLRWVDVDLDAGRLAVTQTVVVADGQPVITTPKNTSSRRSVSLPGETVARLRAHRARQVEQRLLMGAGWDVDRLGLVFTRADGALIHPSTARFWFDQAVRRVGLPKLRLHDLRHGWATAALRAGVHPKVVAETLGHASVSVTLDVYSHATEGMHRDATETVAGLFTAGS